jgi:hypothetical protein
MFADAFCEENPLRDERHGKCRTAVPPASTAALNKTFRPAQSSKKDADCQ